MQIKKETNHFANTCFLASTFCALLLSAALLVYFLVPSAKTTEVVDIPQFAISNLNDEIENEATANFPEFTAEVSFTNMVIDKADQGLNLYRQAKTRSAVEWFYFQITGSKSVTQAILAEADKNDIPLALAFALAHTESNFNARAVNKNSNTTTDRGLFQLNSNSFPELTEEDFFDPFISSKYGMSHLKFCLKSAGNEVSALAMYNAGTNRVRSNKTPQSTLNYVGKIMTYQKMLEQLFDEQVVAYFETQLVPGMSLAMADKQ